MDEPETALTEKPAETANGSAGNRELGQGPVYHRNSFPDHSVVPDAEIFSFDSVPLKKIRYEETEHFRIYRDFMADPKRFLQEEEKE
jgi:hypothetical protein